MSDWRLLSAAPGRRTRVQVQSDGTFLIHSEQDFDPILAANKALREHSDRGYVGDGTFRRVASIPNNEVFKWLVEDGIDVFNEEHAHALARKLNDPDYAYLRTAPGRIGVSNGGIR